MASEIVKNWFGDDFSKLSEEIQSLHLEGGVLEGEVDIQIGTGLAGILVRRLSKNLNLPGQGKNKLRVTIFHSDEGLHWNRTFNDSIDMKSIFKPVGSIESGYWIENTGSVKMKLTVDIKDGGWYWRCLSFRFFGVPLPASIFPESQAYKRIKDGGYEFYVAFKAPVLGLLLSYGGILDKK